MSGRKTVQLRDQDLLALEAALFPGSALSAWMHFKDRYEVDDLYPPSIELLPLIQHTLTNRCKVYDEPLFRKIAGVQRRNWYSNQILAKKLSVCVRTLRAEGIDVMISQGTALALLYYEHLGLRRIGEYNIVVRGQHFAETEDILSRFGLKRFQPDEHGNFLVLSGSVMCVGEGRGEEEFWSRSQSFDLFGAECRCLCPVDQLIQVLLDTTGDTFLKPLWIADINQICAKVGNADEVEARIHQLRIAATAADAVSTLIANYPRALDVQIIRALSSKSKHYRTD